MRVFRILSYIVAVVAVLLGILLSELPKKAGLYRRIAKQNPMFVGYAPAFVGTWGYSFESLYENDLRGQLAIVTGANSGVGFETAKILGELGADVILACRNAEKCKTAANTIRNSHNVTGNIDTLFLDTSKLKSVQEFARAVRSKHGKLDMLYLNAGIGSGGVHPNGTVLLSEDNIEMVFATNHVGHFLLYKNLEPILKESAMARVILTSSCASFSSFDYLVANDRETLNNVNVYEPWGTDMKVYGQSKLAQILFAKHLTNRLGESSNIYVNAVHPGAVDTGIWEKNPLIPAVVQKIIAYFRKNVMWTARDAALTMLYLGVEMDDLKAKNIRGKYFHPQVEEVINPLAMNTTLQRDVWEFSEQLVRDFLE